uniref:Uncharacterized protein n=1 Tax=Anguilla anguilla TaxID=7936 RepID=A0A0E9VXU9_ANGAN
MQEGAWVLFLRIGGGSVACCGFLASFPTQTLTRLSNSKPG